MVLGAGLALQSQPFGATAARRRLLGLSAAFELRYFAQ